VLYLDSSALIKHYVKEAGSEEIEYKLRDEEHAARPVFTSVLTFAEIHAALARRMKDKSLPLPEFHRARRKFDSDWVLRLSPIDLGPGVLSIVRDVVTLGLKGADAVHLASAIWLKDAVSLGLGHPAKGDTLIFLTADEKLAQAAARKHLEVFNPQNAE
jgi:predicted nucleic acid-binding protein